MADNNLLDEPENFDEVDRNLFAVQLRNLRTVSNQEAQHAPYQRRLRKIAHKLYPVGAEAFKESLLRLKQRVREDGRIQSAWESKCGTYDQNETFEEVREKLSWLPVTVCDVYVLDIVARITSTKNENNTKVHFLSDHVVGPGVQAAFKANLCLWGFYIFYPFIAYLTSFIGWWTCKEKNFAEYHVEVLMLYIPVVLAVMYYEYKAMIYALPPQVAIMGKFERKRLDYLPSRVDSFGVWFLGASFMSLVAHMDLATNSLFLSKVLATKQCDEMTHIEDAWEAVFSKTVFRFIAEPPSFLFVVFAFWLLLFGQFFYGIASSVPIATRVNEPKNLGGVRQLLGLGDGDLYEVKDRDQGGKAFGFKTYPTILHPRTQHESSLRALAESGRMYTIRYNAWSLQRELAGLHLYKSGQLFKEVLRTLAFFLVFMWFENIVQLELQGSALELGKVMSQKLDKEMAFSLLLSLMMAFYNHFTVCGRFWAQTRACMDADEHDDREECRKYNRRVKIYCKILRPVFVMVAVVFALFLLHAVMKTFMVSFVCDCGWNIRINPVDGCISRRQNGTCPFRHSDGTQ